MASLYYYFLSFSDSGGIAIQSICEMKLSSSVDKTNVSAASLTNTKMFVWLKAEINLKEFIYTFEHQKIPQLVIFQPDQLFS